MKTEVNFLNLTKLNNIFIFSRHTANETANFIVEFKKYVPECHVVFISANEKDSTSEVTAIEIDDSFQTKTTRIDFQRMVTIIGAELTNYFANDEALEFKTNIIIVMRRFNDIDSTLLTRLKEALPVVDRIDASSETLKINGRMFNDTEVVVFQDILRFDDFISRMNNFKGGDISRFMDLVSFYARVTP